ncbi:alpha/beta hydrolase [Pseudoduganella violaceinigra]|uniref:alpha/beta hydrolase n=1 Tax=Pseudoduganella violaceinigra TaxID=246602 RepID=UPI0003F76CF5|nr:alpha/beta fold hydrolase [Pseudoduganella violaceinigra]
MRSPLLALMLAPVLAMAQPGKDCHLPGTEESLKCVRLAVPLDHHAPGATLTLHVAVASALRETARRDPLFLLAGGPGEAGSDLVPLLNSTFRKVRATRDIVLIDQRGTGLSGKLDCKPGKNSETATEDELLAETRSCIQGLNKPLNLYTTEQAARDIEAVRGALGYGRINLWGGSYGSRLAQAYARLFPGSVRSLVLDGVAAPDQVVPAGAHDAQAALEALFRQCGNDTACASAFPGLRSEFDALAARLAKSPQSLTLPDPRTAESSKVQMTSMRFLGTVHNILYSQSDSRRLPFLIHSAYQDRWQPFIARSNVSRDFASDGGPAMPLHLAVVCAEDYPRLTPQLLEEDTKGSFLGAPQITRIGKMCESMAVPAVPYQEPSTITAPVLLLSGALDPVTPPRRAEAARKYMKHAQHLIVKNGGHIVSPLGCAPRLLRTFLDQPAEPLKADCLNEIPAPTFQLNSAGPQP